jgi:hypothetical protein
MENISMGTTLQNKYYFSIIVTEEQKEYAKQLVEYSIKHHPIPNIWDSHKKEKTKLLRITGTIGEIIFADLYELERPKRSFGAIDGQDFGKDFELIIEGISRKLDIKTMNRKSNVFFKNYVLNIPARNINRLDSVTDYYYCISLHKENNHTIASIIGYIKKEDIIKEKIGVLHKKGAKRIRLDKTYFTFYEDTYEVFFKNIKKPILTEKIKKIESFKKLFIR